MNVTTFLTKLSKSGTSYIRELNGDKVEFQMKITKDDLVNNIDLLAKELHMLVETEAKRERSVRDSRIFQDIGVEQKSILEYIDNLK